VRVAVIGAGIVGVSTAFELAAQGHEVLVLERRSSVAAEASFAQAGIVAPALVQPGSGAWPAGLVSRPGLWPWLWQRLRAQRDRVRQPAATALHQLATASRARLLELTQSLDLDFEQADGVLLLLPGEAALRAHRPVLKRLADAGLGFELVDAEQARRIEPALNPAAPLRAAVHLPQDLVGNGRQFAHRLKAEATRLGARFRFDSPVVALRPGSRPELVLEGGTTEIVDALVLCTGAEPPALLGQAGLRLPMQPVWGLSVTAPVNHVDGQLPQAPRAAVLDARHQVSISRLGQRVRVAGGVQVGGRPAEIPLRRLRQLYRVLEHWFPGSAVMREAQHWQGARPTLPDGLPLLGASGLPGVWLNLGHAGHGWALASGSAQALAATIAGRDAGIDLAPLAASRWR
jgi:D-amino-acid dehydrogenase